MVNDWEQRYVVWKPEFVAFAAEQGRTPEEQDAHDRGENPERPRTAFAAWLAKQAAASPSADPPELTLARLALQVDTRMLPPAKWKAMRDAAEAVIAKTGRT